MKKALGRIFLIITFLIFSVVYFIEAIQFDNMEEKLIIVFVFWGVVITSLIELVKLIIEIKKSDEHINLKGVDFKSIIKDKKVFLFVSMIIYIYIIPLLGFFSSSFLVFVVLTYALGARNKSIPIISSLSLCVIMYLLFIVLLNLNVPGGLLI